MQIQTPTLDLLYKRFLEPTLNFEERHKIETEIIEYITFSNPTVLKNFMINLSQQSEEEFYYMPFFIRALIFRLLILQTPDDVEMMKWAIDNLSWFIPAGPGSVEYVEDLKKKVAYSSANQDIN